MPTRTCRKGKVPSDVKSLHKEVVNYRRHFHMHPELSLQEYKTADFVEEKLKEWGFEPKRMVKTGVVALLSARKPGPTIMLRADMDALPVKEENVHSFISTVPGKMHACGHDAHMAMLLGLAKLFKSRGIPRGRIKFCFQPGEEGADGAGKMVKAGVLKDPKVDFAFGMHVWSPIPTGQIAVLPGPCMASVDEFEVKVAGNGGHAAYPHTATDPVLASAHVITALQSVVSRNVNPLRASVLTVASIHAGSAFNIIPPEAVFRGTIRTFDSDVRALMEKRFKEVVQATASALGCTADINFKRMIPATVNDRKMSEFVKGVAEKVVGNKNVIDHDPTMGGEDFARYAGRVPGVFAWVGARNEQVGAVYPHHHPKFNIDEDALLIGMEFAKEVTLEYLKNF